MAIITFERSVRPTQYRKFKEALLSADPRPIHGILLSDRCHYQRRYLAEVLEALEGARIIVKEVL